VKQVPLDQVTQQQTDTRSRHKGQRHVQNKRARLGIPGCGPGQVKEGRPELPCHRQDRAKLNENLKRGCLRPAVREQVTRHDEVPGGRHGKELGEPFDNTKYDGAENGHDNLFDSGKYTAGAT